MYLECAGELEETFILSLKTKLIEFLAKVNRYFL